MKWNAAAGLHFFIIGFLLLGKSERTFFNPMIKKRHTDNPPINWQK